MLRSKGGRRENQMEKEAQNPTTRMGHARGLLSNDSGISFIDLMLAVVVLTIGVLALADLQTISARGNNSSQRMNAAIAVAETKLEAIKGTLYGNIVAEAPTPVTASGLTFTRQVTVTSNSPVANVKTVKVIVTWSDSAGITHTVPMATIVSQ